MRRRVALPVGVFVLAAACRGMSPNPAPLVPSPAPPVTPTRIALVPSPNQDWARDWAFQMGEKMATEERRRRKR